LAAKAKGEKLTDGMNDLLDSIVEVIEAPKGSLPSRPALLCPPTAHCPLRDTHIYTHRSTRWHLPITHCGFCKVALAPFGVSSASRHWVSAR